MSKLNEGGPIWVLKIKWPNKRYQMNLATVWTTQHKNSSGGCVTFGSFSKSYITF